MKLAHFLRNSQTRIGIVKEGSIFDLATAAREQGISHLENVQTIDEILSDSALIDLLTQSDSKLTIGASIPVDSVKMQSPILKPEKIFCAAVNYLSHIKEKEASPPTQPYFFTKFRNSIVGPEDPILIPRASKKVDWEAELAVIIGKKGKYISRNEADEYVAGYTIANDVSFRDLQYRENWSSKASPPGHDWVKGKGLDNAFPMGPWLVTSDELKNPYDCKISLSVNGQLRQNSVIGDMVFKINELIEYLSQGITLSPGDVISTGTPHGVGAFTGGPFLKEGDIVEVEIERIGKLCNVVRSE